MRTGVPRPLPNDTHALTTNNEYEENGFFSNTVLLHIKFDRMTCKTRDGRISEEKRVMKSWNKFFKTSCGFFHILWVNLETNFVAFLKKLGTHTQTHFRHTLNLEYEGHLEIKLLCTLYSISLMTEEICVDFHFWDQRKLFFVSVTLNSGFIVQHSTK